MHKLLTLLCLFVAATVTAQEAAEGNKFRLDIDDEASEVVAEARRLLKKNPESAGRLVMALLSRSASAKKERLVEFSDIVLPTTCACLRILKELPADVREKFDRELEALSARVGKVLGEEEMVARFGGSVAADDAVKHLAAAAIEKGDGATAIRYLALLKQPDELLLAVAKALCGDTKPLGKLLPTLPPAKRALFASLAAKSAPPPAKPLTLQELASIVGKTGQWHDRAVRLSSFGVDILVEPKAAFVGRTLWFALPGGWLAYDAKTAKKACSIRIGKSEGGWLRVVCWAETDGSVVVGLHSGKRPFISCVDARTRRLLWVSTSRDGVSDLMAVSAPTVAAGRVFWLGVRKGGKRASLWVVCQNIHGGLIWRKRLGSEVWESGRRKRVMIPGRGMRWEETSWRCCGYVMLSGPFLLFVSGSGLAGCLESTSGRVVWLMLYPVVRRRGLARIPFLWRLPRRLCQAPLLLERNYKGRKERWFVFAPGDSDVVVAVREDGMKWWWRKVVAWRVLLPLSDGMLFLAERRPLYSRFEEGDVDISVKLRVLDPATGRLRFSKRLERESRIRGAFALADNLLAVVMDERLTVYEYLPQKAEVTQKKVFPAQMQWLNTDKNCVVTFSGEESVENAFVILRR